tara:strand:- start:24830 stop:25057 length:228 start_codon:yes stop_codon:yes gene_type:complete
MFKKGQNPSLQIYEKTMLTGSVSASKYCFYQHLLITRKCLKSLKKHLNRAIHKLIIALEVKKSKSSLKVRFKLCY